MEKKRTVPWKNIFGVIGILLFVIAAACYLLLNQTMLGVAAALIGTMLIDFAMFPDTKRTTWQKLRWPAVIMVALIWTGFASFGRHTYTGVITKIMRVEERHNGYHYEVTLQSDKQTYHFEDSVNMLVGKSHYLHLHVSDKRVKVITSGVLPNNPVIQQNILSVK